MPSTPWQRHPDGSSSRSLADNRLAWVVPYGCYYRFLISAAEDGVPYQDNRVYGSEDRCRQALYAYLASTGYVGDGPNPRLPNAVYPSLRGAKSPRSKLSDAERQRIRRDVPPRAPGGIRPKGSLDVIVRRYHVSKATVLRVLNDPKLTTRPVAKRRYRKRGTLKPPADHPWKQFVFGKKEMGHGS